MDKRWDHKKNESLIYQKWEKSSAFSPVIPHNASRATRRPFTIIMPPPNANGVLHVGHALFVALEDIMIRYRRMLGEASLWVPGADHAGIATQVTFEKELAKKGKTRFDLGRDEFYRQVYEFSQKNKEGMYSQLKALGASCDWTREKFTLDPEISREVLKTFVDLYKEELVYRGERLVNWCPRCQTTLADLEVDHEERRSKLWHIKYPLKAEGRRQKAEYITVATTRPETMLGDTAVAVNPKDKRYKTLIGKTLILPFVGREIPIIADDSVDPDFGTGAVKVTPAHDGHDFEIGARHNLPSVQVIGFDDRMTQEAGRYNGSSKFEARGAIIKELKERGLLEKEEDYTHSVGVCERCETTIEPLVSLQWFVKMEHLAKPAIKAVKVKKVKFVPRRFEKIYFHWMENIKDWPVSRQLWWGHRIPVWYCGTKNMSPLQKTLNKIEEQEGCGEVVVSVDKPKMCLKCEGSHLVQDPDTLDTWFSSGQWPYTVLGFAKNGDNASRITHHASPDFEYFYPTDVMETGYEIIFLWVARMIMFGLYRTGKVPFHTVYLHGIVRDKHGQKMSKSKGNVIDPLEMIEKYGADALRMSLVVGNTPGNDMSLSEEKIIGYRNFANKIWNIGRFAVSAVKLEDKNQKTPGVGESRSKEKHRVLEDAEAGSMGLQAEDKEILKRLDRLVESVTKDLDNFKFSQAGGAIYEFTWHYLADVYIEQVKRRLRDGDEAAASTLLHAVRTCLKLLHLYMPYVTEAVWGELGEEEMLMTAKWPSLGDG